MNDPRAQAEAIARAHDENFPVAFMLAPRDIRADMRAIYAYCRVTDDIGDAGDASPDERLAMLDAWDADLARCWDGTPDDPILIALQAVVRRRALAPDPFHALVDANRMDQRISRWETHDDLVDYCRLSAMPVGRMVLGVLGLDDERRGYLSDATCAGLQLVNFWQDIRRDLDERDRVYLPADDMALFGVTTDDLTADEASPAVRELVRMEVWRARAMLIEGAPLRGLVPRRVRHDIAMFTSGGLWVCDAIAKQGFDTIARRPAPGKAGRARMAAGVLRGAVRGA